ncbi:MAG: sugar-transfer associated ATP-grasp domain-containing protein [Lacunisphaera sp.]
MLSKLLIKMLARVLRSRGYSGYFAQIGATKIYDDLLNGAKIGPKRRWWGYRRGFLGNTVAYYGLTEETYHLYLPDFHYFKLHPMNGVWGKWIDDKLTTRFVLAPFADCLPRHYFHLRGGEICRLMDCPEVVATSVEGMLQLLKQEIQLAVKIVEGSGGVGFYKLEWRNGGVLINRKPVTIAEFEQFVSDCADHIVSEYATAHAKLREIYPHTANTMRVWTFHGPGLPSSIGGAIIRFGTNKSGVVDNVAAGGICCGVRVADGSIFEPCAEERTKVTYLTVHPDTGVPVAGVIPHWERVKEKVLEICAYVPELCYLGFDVVVTDEGMKILEINSHQDPSVQLHQPFLRDPVCRKFFLQALKTKGIEIDQA